MPVRRLNSHKSKALGYVRGLLEDSARTVVDSTAIHSRGDSGRAIQPCHMGISVGSRVHKRDGGHRRCRIAESYALRTAAFCRRAQRRRFGSRPLCGQLDGSRTITRVEEHPCSCRTSGSNLLACLGLVARTLESQPLLVHLRVPPLNVCRRFKNASLQSIGRLWSASWGPKTEVSDAAAGL